MKESFELINILETILSNCKNEDEILEEVLNINDELVKICDKRREELRNTLWNS